MTGISSLNRFVSILPMTICLVFVHLSIKIWYDTSIDVALLNNRGVLRNLWNGKSGWSTESSCLPLTDVRQLTSDGLFLYRLVSDLVPFPGCVKSLCKG